MLKNQLNLRFTQSTTKAIVTCGYKPGHQHICIMFQNRTFASVVAPARALVVAVAVAVAVIVSFYHNVLQKSFI